jgi:hypothetical protein
MQNHADIIIRGPIWRLLAARYVPDLAKRGLSADLGMLDSPVRAE